MLIHNTHADVITIKETKLTPKAKEPKVHNFTTRRTDRLHKLGGGMLLLLFTHSHNPCWWGESDLPAGGPPAGISVHLASSAVTPVGSVHKSMGDNVVHMLGAVEEMMCDVCA